MDIAELVQVLAEFPKGARVNAVRSNLYVTSGTDILGVINLETSTVTRPLPPPETAAQKAAMFALQEGDF